MRADRSLPRRRARLVALALLACPGWVAGNALAWSLPINGATSRVFLHVGTGTADNNNNTVDRVTADLTPAQLLSGAAQPMVNSGGQSRSLSGDNFATCPTPASQVLVGASYRRNGNSTQQATLSVSAPANLVSVAGDTIPITEISWTVAAPGSPVPGVIRAGTFAAGQQQIATVPPNTFIENCHSFRYANSAIRAAGTYDGTVTYTLSTP